MEYVYIGRRQDNEYIEADKEYFAACSLKELVDCYNHQVKCGIVGVHRQALYLIALRSEFKERLKESPVYIQTHVMGMVGPIELVNGNIRVKLRS